MIKPGKRYYFILSIIILLLLIPALLINLGLLPLIADEATRAVVSMEMKFTGNFLAPTINGELYFNKPPLYNWILVLFFSIAESYSELIVRLPSLLSLLIFAFIIWRSTKKEIGSREAFISALAFITCGRVLFYDSMLGLIDLSFSMLVFLNFILIYQLAKQEKYFLLFLISYLLTSLAFLMKGLPAILFQALTIMAAMVFFKQIKKLFSLSHFVGILLFLILTGGYYYLALRENPGEPYLSTLLSESTSRTFMEHGWMATFIHLFTFPAEQLIQLFPWSILILFLFQKSFYAHIRKNQFLTYLSIVFIVNIPVYWISVETYPRYLFALYPIILILLIDFFFKTSQNSLIYKMVSTGIVFLALAGILTGTWLYFQHDFSIEFNKVLVYSIALIIALALVVIAYKAIPYRLEIILIFLLIARTGFNLVILPERHATSRQVVQRQDAAKAALLAGDSEIKTLKISPVSMETFYYIMRETGKIISAHEGEPVAGYCYLLDDRIKVRSNEEVLLNFETRWENSPIRISKFKN